MGVIVNGILSQGVIKAVGIAIKALRVAGLGIMVSGLIKRLIAGS
jgi:hypothetical protein